VSVRSGASLIVLGGLSGGDDVPYPPQQREEDEALLSSYAERRYRSGGASGSFSLSWKPNGQPRLTMEGQTYEVLRDFAGGKQIVEFFSGTQAPASFASAASSALKWPALPSLSLPSSGAPSISSTQPGPQGGSGMEDVQVPSWIPKGPPSNFLDVLKWIAILAAAGLTLYAIDFATKD
jgi:hypothetical protein